ncbi:MAG: UDP-N-acetylmuramoyl-L-alanine--D-glutamate ligase [Planctomycetota bacterium]
MSWRGRRVTVMGLGLFGGGLGATRYLARQGAEVLVTDLRNAEALEPSLAGLRDLPVRYRLGEHLEKDFVETDGIVANPAVPWSSPFLEAARAAGVPVTTELGLFLGASPARLIAVTGSNGKSTVTSLIGRALERSGLRTFVGGNLGGSLLDHVDELRAEDRVVLEMSSFQLEALSESGLAPWISVVTSLSPNHLDRHGTWERYVAAKGEVLRNQGPKGIAILNGDDPGVRAEMAGLGRARRLWFGADAMSDAFVDGADGVWHSPESGRREALFDRSRLRLLGRFNAQNALAAAVAARVAGADPASTAAAIESFQGLPHRLELAGQVRGALWVNDSKATNPAATIAALHALDRPVVVLIGGRNKGMDPSELASVVRGRARAAVCFGEMASELREALRVPPIPVALAPDLSSACAAASTLAQPGDAVLLSPGFASFDEFQSFEQRGERFREIVRRLEIEWSEDARPIDLGGMPRENARGVEA